MKDEELDHLLRQIARDAALDDAAADDIANSPSLWWNVQREIRSAEPVKAPWPPSVLTRWLAVSVPAAAALAFAVLFYSGTFDRTAVVADVPQQTPVAAPAPIVSAPPTSMPTGVPRQISADVNSKRPVTVATYPTTKRRARRIDALTAGAQPKGSPEIRSDFIALAYAREPESGQILRVKVPSSMMVTLGVVPTVEKPSELIDAEVLVGDDGLTHAIRFIHQ